MQPQQRWVRETESSSMKRRSVPQADLVLRLPLETNSGPADSYIISIPPPKERTTTTPRKQRKKDSKHTTPSKSPDGSNDQPTSNAHYSDDSAAWLDEERADSLVPISNTTSNDAESSQQQANRPATPPSTPRKKLGRLGYDGRQWSKGYHCQTEGKPWRDV